MVRQVWLAETVVSLPATSECLLSNLGIIITGLQFNPNVCLHGGKVGRSGRCLQSRLFSL